MSRHSMGPQAFHAIKHSVLWSCSFESRVAGQGRVAPDNSKHGGLVALAQTHSGNIGCDRNLQQELFGRSLCLTQLGCPQSPLCLHAGPLISRVEVPVAAVLVFPLGSRGCGSARELSPHRPIASERMLQVSSCLSAPSDSAPASGVLSRPRH